MNEYTFHAPIVEMFLPESYLGCLTRVRMCSYTNIGLQHMHTCYHPKALVEN